MLRFPEDFMFQLTDQEFNEWRSQFVTSNEDKMGLRYAPYAFTEDGVAQLSTVLETGGLRTLMGSRFSGRRNWRG